MKLSKQERIATIVILIIVILTVGIFVFIKPAFENMSSTQQNLDNKKAEYSAVVEKQARKNTLRDQIIETYKDGEHMADMFFPELTSYQADEALRAFLAQCKSNIVVEEVSVEEPTTSTLSPYFFIPEEVVYELKSYANQGVSTDEATQKRLDRLAKLQMALGGEQTIGSSTVSFAVSAIDREELLRFADDVNEYIVKENGKDTRKAIILNGMSFSFGEVDEEYNDLVEKLNAQAEAEGQAAFARETGKSYEGKAGENSGNESDKEGEVNVEDVVYRVDTSITFFSIERMQDPTAQLDRQDGLSA